MKHVIYIYLSLSAGSMRQQVRGFQWDRSTPTAGHMPVLFRWDDDGDVQKPAAWRYDESSQEEDSGGESSSSSSSSSLGKILQNILKHFGDQ